MYDNGNKSNKPVYKNCRKKKMTLSYLGQDKTIFFPVGNVIEQYAGIYGARNLMTIGAFSMVHSAVLDPRLIKLGRRFDI